ncbi:hypothetical protein LLH00_05120 [bacterium]|nr:hypothetical protein [bacterium]
MSETPMDDRALRNDILARLYAAWQAEGLYRGVLSRKALATELRLENQTLERNLEYLLERGLVRMHKIEDLVSITPDGIDRVETGGAPGGPERIEALLARLEKLLGRILERLES